MHAWKWQPVERAILRALALQVRLMTLDQTVRTWFAANDKLALESLRSLERAALLQHQLVEAHPLLSLTQPLLTWTPQDRTPTDEELQEASETAFNRWPLAEQPIEVWMATRQACHVFGTFHRPTAKSCEATHDLHVAEVFVRFVEQNPESAESWLGEAAFPKLGFEIRGMKDPDAFIVDASGSIQRVVEFAGKYDAEHLRSLHNHCSGQAHDRIVRSAKNPGDQLSRLYSASGTEYEIW